MQWRTDRDHHKALGDGPLPKPLDHEKKVAELTPQSLLI
jgi:hypothetical protein